MATKQVVNAATNPRGIKRVTDLLAHLNSKPQLKVQGLKSLKLTYAFRNDHFGARHFAKEDLPRIRYANPDLDIKIQMAIKKASHTWKPEMELEFENGQTQTLSLDSKYSSTILQELMSIAGASEWQQHVRDCQAKGIPPVTPPPAVKKTPRHFKAPEESAKLPTFDQFKAILEERKKDLQKRTEINKVKKAQEKKEAAKVSQAEAAAPLSAPTSAPAPTAE